jgi:hypothetical protein
LATESIVLHTNHGLKAGEIQI